MTLNDYISEIKLELTGNVLNLEISDETLGQVVNKAFREVQRYIDETRLVTVPFAPCIDLDGFKSSAVVNVYRTEGYTGDTNSGMTLQADPMQAQMWMAFSNGGTMYNLQDYVLNYLSYNTLLQMRNTASTDLSFREDKSQHRLYINSAYDSPSDITIEYVPEYESVEDIVDPYWTDILCRLAVAMTKITLGRIRSRFTQSNALWSQDGETLLSEGNEELTALRETLRVNAQLSYGVD